jgi:transcription elongation factor GreB
MSKAFTRESDDGPELPVRPRASSTLPPGAKNYMTPDGARRLRDELNGLLERRPSLAASPDKELELATMDARILQLQDSLGSAVVAAPPPPPWEQVRFGATVKVRERAEVESYRIVGADETDIDRGWISWLSPLARALTNSRLGQKVRFRRPSGEAELEIIEVTYE